MEITLRSGARVVADFYHCTECSLHFVHPERFMRVEEGAPQPESVEQRLEPA